MPFPITENSTPAQIRALIDLYYSNLPGALVAHRFLRATDPARLVDDYCQIGSFLSNRGAVRAALAPLETTLRARIATLAASRAGGFALPQTAVAAAPATTRRDEGGQAAVLKSHKLLSGALHDAETLYGFNHERMVTGTMIKEAVAEDATLHSEALGARGGSTRFAPMGRTPQTKTALPSGVPTVVGPLNGGVFNMVLLRHGYQFKDVAAGPYHGEYTHRLQWYAICNSGLPLANTPLEIFKSMGYAICGGDQNIPADRHLFIWELLFDAGPSDKDAKDISGTLAWSQNTFNCPETVTKELMQLNGRSPAQVADLWHLRVLVKTRWKKRFDENDAGQDKVARVAAKAGGGQVKMMVADSTTTDEKTLDQLQRALVWYLRN